MAGKGILTRFFDILGRARPSPRSSSPDPNDDGALTFATGSYEMLLGSPLSVVLPPEDLISSRQQARLDRIQESINMDESFGINTALLHLSALDRTTRLSHAKRHGKVFTREQVIAFFEDPKNHKGCTCSLVVVLLGPNGNPVLTKEMKQRHADEFSAWQKVRRWR